MAGYTPMMKQYLDIKDEYEDCLLFFRLGDFYELFFEDAKIASKELEITLTSRDGGREERVPMCGVPYHSANTYIARLVKAGYKVAICEQMEDPAQAKGVVRREVVQVITPGTVTDDLMLEEKRNNFLIAVCQNGQTYGLAATDISTGELRYATLTDRNALIDEVAAYEPAEILMDGGTQSEVKQEIERYVSALVHDFEDVRLSSDQARELLEEQFDDVPSSVVENDLAVKTVGSLLLYVKKTQKRALRHLQGITVYEANEYMVLDVYARRNLELTETIRDKKRQGSLLSFLDHTATAMGGRLLKKWLDKPLLNRRGIEERLTAVEALAKDMLLTKDVQEILKGVYDLERLAARIASGTANARDLVALKRSLHMLPQLQKVSERAGDAFTRLCDFSDLCSDIAEVIDRAIVDEPPVSVKEGGVIRPGFNEELDELLEAKRSGKAWLARLEQKEREATGIKSLKIGYNRVFGYYLEVTKANLHLLPAGRYQRKQTLANAERFITPELKEKEALILEAEERAVELEYELFVQLRENVSLQVERLQKVAHSVATLDVLQSLATVSARYGYVRPEMTDGLQLTIKGGRHPVVEQVLDDGAFTPNDTVLNPQKEQIALITGPNMAGKSTYMRQVALIVLMAHIGCFVPATKACIPLVDRIFTRIGAADDLVGGQSTFMVEMLETRHAITQATERSLILLDEIGRGTSTYDGMAIAHAVIEYIHENVKAKTLFSTHYHELTALAEQFERVTNVHARCEEREGELLFLHRIESGRADRSYGIHVAELAGMPKSVIDRARTVLTELESRQQTAASGLDTGEQLSFFLSEDPERAREREIVSELKKWDLLNHTPLETVQFIEKLQKKLMHSAIETE